MCFPVMVESATIHGVFWTRTFLLPKQAFLRYCNQHAHATPHDGTDCSDMHFTDEAGHRHVVAQIQGW